MILGAGSVGVSVAESLCSELNDITVIDTNSAQLAALQDRADLKTIVGNGTHVTTLRQAGVDDADLFIATAAKDETNLVACQLASKIFNVPNRIARIRAPEFQNHPEITGDDGFCVDYLICPVQTVCDYIEKLIEFPEALQVLEFADGKACLIAVRAYAGGPLVSQPIRELKAHIPNIDCRIVAIYRAGRTVDPDGSTMIEAGDEVFFLAATENIREVLSELRSMDKPVRRIMIAGGGNIGLRLGRALADRYQVKLIEANRERCDYLAMQLGGKSLVLHGDSTDEDLLIDENVADMDLFIALTSDDENNIMSCMLAKRLGARRVISLINRQAYAELMEGSRIDIAIVPAQTTIGQLLTHVRRGDIAAVHSLRRGAAEAIEGIAHGDAKSSKLVGRKIEEVELPKGAAIGAIVRQREGQTQVIMAHHDILIHSDDHIIVFVSNRSMIPKVEKLFQVGVGFF